MAGKEEIENFKQIIAESEKRLATLKVLSNFFNHPDLIAVSIRTRVIHNLFEGNQNLDIHKLDLFHIQYTASLIDLFHKLKKQKEQKYLMISDEISINEEYIKKLETEIVTAPFADEMRAYSAKVRAKMEELYKVFSGENNGPFSWNELLELAAKRGPEFYREISEEQFKRLTAHDTAQVYKNDICTIEKKLLGKLNIQQFRAKMVCGLEYNNEFLEIFEFINTNDKFIFINSKKAFYLLDSNNLAGVDISKNESNRKKVIEQLINKTDHLKEQLGTIKGFLPNDVEIVLKSYLEKISGVEFLDDLQNVDEQTNILKAMLNINIK
jgi:hypothetical protein